MIGDSIVVTVHRIDQSRVSLHIEAPKSIRITRGELVGMDVAAALKLIEQSDAITDAQPKPPREPKPQFRTAKGANGQPSLVKVSHKIRRSTDSADQSTKINDGAA